MSGGNRKGDRKGDDTQTPPKLNCGLEFHEILVYYRSAPQDGAVAFLLLVKSAKVQCAPHVIHTNNIQR